MGRRRAMARATRLLPLIRAVEAVTARGGDHVPAPARYTPTSPADGGSYPCRPPGLENVRAIARGRPEAVFLAVHSDAGRPRLGCMSCRSGGAGCGSKAPLSRTKRWKLPGSSGRLQTAS